MIKQHLMFSLDNDVVIHKDSDADFEVSIDTVHCCHINEFTEHTPNISNTYTPSNGDKFYFLPGVVIPRIKLKDLYSQYKIANVRDMEKATHIFCGSGTFSSMTYRSWMYDCKTESFLKFIEAAYENGGINKFYYDKVKDALEFYTNEYVLIKDFATIRFITDDDLSYGIKNGEVTGSSKSYIKVNPDYEDIYSNVVKLNLYDDQSLMPYINGSDAVTLDENMYETLNTMLSSSDKDNTVVAMEIMSNCNFKESILYLTVLFHDFGHKFSDMPSKNHVNFKTLLNFMGLTSRGMSISRDMCVEILKNKNAVTVENMQFLLNKFGASIPTEAYSKYFIVKTVCLTPELDAMINDELSLTLKEDYTPVINETEITNEHINDNFLNF
jgi:hypothetical protein